MILKTLNDIITNTAKTSPLVNEAFAGDVYEINAKENKFGCFVATPITATRSQGFVSYNYILYYIDRLTKDESNMDLVHSDAITMLNGLCDKLEEKYSVEIQSDSQFTFFRHNFDDWCAGAYLEVDILTPDGDCGNLDFDTIYDLRPITITKNGVFKPLGFDGYSEVKVDIPVPEDVATKGWVLDQEYLAETDLKTINGQSIVGEGNITIEGSSKPVITLTLNEQKNGFKLDSEFSKLGQYASHLGDVDVYVNCEGRIVEPIGKYYLDKAVNIIFHDGNTTLYVSKINSFTGAVSQTMMPTTNITQANINSYLRNYAPLSALNNYYSKTEVDQKLQVQSEEFDRLKDGVQLEIDRQQDQIDRAYGYVDDTCYSKEQMDLKLDNYATQLDIQDVVRYGDIWNGPEYAWNSLSDEEKQSYIIALIF